MFLPATTIIALLKVPIFIEEKHKILLTNKQILPQASRFSTSIWFIWF